MHLAGVFVTYFLVHLFQTAGTHNCTGSDSFRIPNFAYHGLAMPAVGLSLLPLSPSDEKLLVQVAGLDTDASTVTCRYGDAIYYPRQWELRRTALVSFPRSGNSWTRTLIQKASGYRTSSIYEEKRGKKPVLPFSEDRFLTKTHFPLYSNPGDPDKLRPRAQLKYFDQAIFLTRNPFDSLLSYFHYQNLAQNFTAKATLEHSSLSIIDMAIYIQDFKDFFNYWLKVPLPMKAVRYEDIKSDPAKCIHEMLQIVLPPPAAIAKNVTALAQWQSHFVARTQCTIQDDLMGQDNFFNTRKSDHFHSLKFYKQDTIELIVSELKHHICHFKYDLLLKPFNVTVDCSEKLK